MPINPYFSDGRMMGSASEQNLVEDLIIESIQTMGFDLVYLPRTLVNLDQLFLEDTLSKFKDAYPIEAYLESVDGFGGNDILSKFGIQMNDSGTFVIARRRWDQLVGKNAGLQLPNRPAEGDLVFFPKTQSYFEIKKVDAFNPFYQLGKLYVYKLQVELYQYSSESFETGNVDIDDTGPIFYPLDMLQYEILTEDGDIIKLEDDDNSSLISEDFVERYVDPSADNTFFKEASTSIIDWSGSNPFGENG